MTKARSERGPGHGATLVERLRRQATPLVGHLADAAGLARATAVTIAGRAPGTVDATLARAHETTSALQTLSDPTLRELAATSVGVGAGFYLAGLPRLVVAAGMAPAVIMGAAILLRRPEPTTTTIAVP